MSDGEMTNPKIEQLNASIKKVILAHLPKAGTLDSQIIDGLRFIRRDENNREGAAMAEPSLGFVIQGQKKTFVGGKEYFYGKNHCVVIGVDVPTSYCATKATKAEPFLTVSLRLDRGLLVELIGQLPPQSESIRAGSAMTVGQMDETLLEALWRLVQLVDRPDEAAVLAPMIIREIHFRVLMTPLGDSLRRFCERAGSSSQIARAIAWLRQNYRSSLSVSELADHVHMGVSTFHRRFKEATNMTPLQYHKLLRLHEAKRLMISENMDATTACYAVGYESPSQFSREYKREFGQPPYRDVKRQKSLRKNGFVLGGA
ncbi:MAG: AraC family transcriptional regulator [Sutterella sp.]|nr:AraC family transcriptional regulator [Sutterella sp.]